MWFHVRGAPGAHVILRQQPGDTASDEDMIYAADLAAGAYTRSLFSST